MGNKQMKRPFPIVFFSLLLIFNFSCNVEKRRYVNGYNFNSTLHFEKKPNKRMAQKDVLNNPLEAEDLYVVVGEDNITAGVSWKSIPNNFIITQSGSPSLNSTIVSEMSEVLQLSRDTSVVKKATQQGSIINRLAIASTVLGTLASSSPVLSVYLSLPAIIIGIISLIIIKRNPRRFRGEGYAFIGIIGGLIGMLWALSFLFQIGL